MRATKTDARLARCAERLALDEKLRAETLKAENGFVTRHGLAALLKCSVRTVDEMVAKGEITPMRPGGVLVRFYLPDVLRQLTAAAVARLKKLKGDTDFTDSHEETRTQQPQMDTDAHGFEPLKTRTTRKQ